ncbi:hypothetical protein [Pseudomonas sp. CNPSo 3701]|uniref:hypothetical protein n=1 Tax=Pseudomonas sp. CNPSo 3701 TaxID=3027943 RepID=UPI002363BDDC|nr:hypothetical protein [Pseudomonas sp. CNPSo 3701]MDD1508090.1 hypothetical protein [Pseudomonas sp. CNPSo 3701]
MSGVTGLPSPIALPMRWSTRIPGLQAQRLWTDPVGGQLLVADGWGVAFGALRLRSLDLQDGHERASVRLGNAARALTREAEGNWLAATDQKLFRLAAGSLQPLAKWTSRIPKYSDQLLCQGDFVLAMNAAASSVSAIDLASGAVKRRALPAAGRLHGVAGDALLICVDGSAWQLTNGLAKAPKRLASLPAHCATAADESGRLWLSLGAGRQADGNGVSWAAPTTLLAVSVSPYEVCVEQDLGLPFWQLEVSRDGRVLWVIGVSSFEHEGETRYRQNQVACFDTADYRCIARGCVPEGFEVKQICPELGLVWAMQAADDQTELSALLGCFELGVAAG